jgi:hypothetical protein
MICYTFPAHWSSWKNGVSDMSYDNVPRNTLTTFVKASRSAQLEIMICYTFPAHWSSWEKLFQKRPMV